MVSMDFIVVGIYVLISTFFTIVNNSIIQAILTIGIPIIYYLDKVVVLLSGLYLDDEDSDDKDQLTK